MPAVPVYDNVSGSYVDFSVDVVWTANSGVERFVDVFNEHESGLIYNAKIKGKVRFADFADAVGTVSDGILNWAPDPSISGYIGNSQYGEVIVTK